MYLVRGFDFTGANFCTAIEGAGNSVNKCAAR